VSGLRSITPAGLVEVTKMAREADFLHLFRLEHDDLAVALQPSVDDSN
jgi:hypothetical protein